MGYVVLAGGVGAAKFLSGLVKAVNPEDISVIVNTGDDLEQFGLYITPDADIIIYTLAGRVNQSQGWGLKEDSYDCLSELKKFGYDTWFNLGDKDLATHIYRSHMLKQGYSLDEITDNIRRAFGVKPGIIPMSNHRVETRVLLKDNREISFEEYLVKHQSMLTIKEIRYSGIEKAKANPKAIKAIEEAEGIIFAPSNPLASIGPILAFPEIKAALKKVRAPKIAVTPIICGKTIKGPADKMMKDLGYSAAAPDIARMYGDIIDAFVLDIRDKQYKDDISKLGIDAIVADTIMEGQNKYELAKRVYSYFTP